LDCKISHDRQASVVGALRGIARQSRRTPGAAAWVPADPAEDRNPSPSSRRFFVQSRLSATYVSVRPSPDVVRSSGNSSGIFCQWCGPPGIKGVSASFQENRPSILTVGSRSVAVACIEPWQEPVGIHTSSPISPSTSFSREEKSHPLWQNAHPPPAPANWATESRSPSSQPPPGHAAPRVISSSQGRAR